MPVIHLISGLPRSGSTLLCNILAQNPRFHVAGTSGLVDMLLNVRAAWDVMPEFRAMRPRESEDRKLLVLRSMLNGYYSPESARGYEIAFDKSRSWLGHLGLAAELIPNLKVLVPVRDVRDILASFEMLWRKVEPLRQIPYEARNYHAFQSAAGRCAVWAAADGPLGIAYNRLRDALQREYSAGLHLVDYNWLTSCPQHAIEEVYNFLGEKFFKHDFDNVEPVTREDDFAYGFPGLHAIRRKVEPAVSRWEQLLGEDAGRYGVLNDVIQQRLSR